MSIADLYIRVSTDEQADKGYSQCNQEEMLRRYCDNNCIQVRKVVYEDHSAKTFNRPEWIKLLTDLKKRSTKTDLVLFTKWDRFSRNAGDAYQMIATLTKLGIDPQAIEQPLDLTIPENKMMLAIYLAAPEVENDRRALNVLHGMRRAKKEGRYMGAAPIGYKNLCTEDGHKYIAPREPQASLMRWVFEEISQSHLNTEQILKAVRLKGLKCSKNNFWIALRNPVYCGKIRIPKYKDEEARMVQGLHEPIISEALFFDVQDVLDGRKKKQRTKKFCDENLPLRGFLLCPKCGRKLTGSASKGRKLHYHYYHCISSCGSRYKADAANKALESEIRKYTPRKEVRGLFKEVIKRAIKQYSSGHHAEKERLTKQIDLLTDKIKVARHMLFSKEITPEEYRESKAEFELEITRIEARLSTIPQQQKPFDIEQALENAFNLADRYAQEPAEQKRKIISSMFPENLVFDGEKYRTTKVNEVMELISAMEAALPQNKNGTNLSEKDLSHLADRTGLEPATSAVTGRHSNRLNYRSNFVFPLSGCKETIYFLFFQFFGEKKKFPCQTAV